MVNVLHVATSVTGVTVGLRKDGSRAVLYDDTDYIKWFSAEEFSSTFEVV
jgi:hypothetical protein